MRNSINDEAKKIFKKYNGNRYQMMREGDLDRYKTTSKLEKYIIEIYAKLEPLARKLNVYKELDTYFAEGTPQNIEGTYCFSGKKGYHYCYTERGEIKMDNVTSSLFEVSYWVIKDYISMMAINFERKNRIEGQDFRRIMFMKELELYNELGGNYKKRAEIDIDEILKIAPFNDSL